MTDMLVRLYDLPPAAPASAQIAGAGVLVRRALVPEKRLVLDWVNARFPSWGAEAEVSFTRVPVSCFVALQEGVMLGFACFDAICPNFFGPMAVAEEAQGRGIGRALLLAALEAQRAAGYAYAIIGGVGPQAFYERAVGAVTIPGSSPGIYRGMLRATADR